MEHLIQTLLPDITAGGASKDALVLVMIWYMLKDLKKKAKTLAESIDTLNKTVAPLALEIAALKEKVNDLKSEYQRFVEETRDRLRDIEKQLPAIWSKVGTRPGDQCPANKEKAS